MEEQLCFHKHDFCIRAEWISAPYEGNGGAVKTTCSQAKPSKVFEWLILDYKAILDLCENEMMSITLFGIFKESIISVENLEIEKWYEEGDTVSVKRSSYHLVPL